MKPVSRRRVGLAITSMVVLPTLGVMVPTALAKAQPPAAPSAKIDVDVDADTR
ncbi:MULTISPECIES: hypothetical protein [Streptomyces]|uniref:hypothetical protein n=1 Tax=Streptomyces TaxID=1883 RepID=UPI0013B469D0|nr:MULTISPECIES: hypothetical protein [Streptomyces]NUV41081.1 hypothetical protein [Streptomyces sp. CAI-24]NUV82682.1 hypothetical protein [Streptomyces sp. CAI-155]